MSTQLAGKTIVVTGAALGLGRAMTLALVEAGACVGALDLPQSGAAMEDLVQAAQAQGAPGKIVPVFADVTRDDEVALAVETLEARGGTIWGLVNNAGRGMQDIGPVQVEPRLRFYDVSPDMWRGVIDVNLTGAFVAARCIAPRLVEAGGRTDRQYHDELSHDADQGVLPLWSEQSGLGGGDGDLVEGSRGSGRDGQRPSARRRGRYEDDTGQRDHGSTFARAARRDGTADRVADER